MSPSVRIATFNILNDLSRWEERRPLLACVLANLTLDLIGLQEESDQSSWDEHR
jgi:hypothetical protein